MINAFIYKKEREDLLKSFAHVTRINYEWNPRTRENTIIIRCGRIHINSTARGRINRSRMHHFERWTSIDGTHRYSFSGLPGEEAMVYLESNDKGTYYANVDAKMDRSGIHVA